MAENVQIVSGKLPGAKTVRVPGPPACTVARAAYPALRMCAASTSASRVVAAVVTALPLRPVARMGTVVRADMMDSRVVGATVSSPVVSRLPFSGEGRSAKCRQGCRQQCECGECAKGSHGGFSCVELGGTEQAPSLAVLTQSGNH
jgi:hypothetical protein